MDEEHRHDGRNDERKQDASESRDDVRDARDDIARRRSGRDTSNDSARALTPRERSERWPIG